MEISPVEFLQLLLNRHEASSKLSLYRNRSGKLISFLIFSTENFNEFIRFNLAMNYFFFFIYVIYQFNTIFTFQLRVLRDSITHKCHVSYIVKLDMPRK